MPLIFLQFPNFLRIALFQPIFLDLIAIVEQINAIFLPLPPILQLFWDAMKFSALWYGSAALSSSSLDWAGEFLMVKWRASLTREAHRHYVKGQVLYSLSQGRATNRLGETVWIDNPDQRIAQVPFFFSEMIIWLLCLVLSNFLGSVKLIRFCGI